jgi:hypothetical protein
MSFFETPPLHDFPDRALRDSLEHPHNLRDVLREVVPKLADRFDCDQARPLKRTFALEDWRGRESDILFLVPFRTADGVQTVLVCVLLEHQSRPDPRMPLRLLLYAVLYWERQWKEWEDNHAEGEPLRLSPILPIVFHTGPKPWKTKRSLAELISGPEELQAFVPEWHVLFWDLAEHSPEELLSATGEFLQALAVVRAEGEDLPTYQAVFSDVLKRLEPLSESDKMRWRDL